MSKPSNGVTLTNNETGSVVSGQAAVKPLTPRLSPPPADMKVRGQTQYDRFCRNVDVVRSFTTRTGEKVPVVCRNVNCQHFILVHVSFLSFFSASFTPAYVRLCVSESVCVFVCLCACGSAGGNTEWH